MSLSAPFVFGPPQFASLARIADLLRPACVFFAYGFTGTLRVLGDEEHERAYAAATEQAAAALAAKQEQARADQEQAAKAVSGYPLNSMSVEEIVQSLRDGAFSHISTLPSLDTYRKAFRIISASASPAAWAFMEEYCNKSWYEQAAFAVYRPGDLIQKVETGEIMRFEGGYAFSGDTATLRPAFPSDQSGEPGHDNGARYRMTQLRMLDHEAMESRGKRIHTCLSDENGMDRGGPATATPKEGDVVVHKESGAVSIVHNDVGDGTFFASFPSLGEASVGARWKKGRSHPIRERVNEPLRSLCVWPTT